VAPERWDHLPCQIKLNPYPPERDGPRRCDLIGEVWISATTGDGSALFTVRADYRDHPHVIAEGNVEPFALHPKAKNS
jgi:hypothetical protein